MNLISISTSSPRSGSDFNFSSACEVLSFDASRSFVGVVDLANPFLAEAAPLEPDRIQPVGVSIPRSRGLRERKNIAGDRRPASDKRVRADANKVVYRDRARLPWPIPRP